MKLTSHLIIENQKYRLITCEYEFTRPINAYGRVCGRSSEGALIYIILVSPDDNDLLFHEWLHKVDERKDGTIIFSTDGNNPSVKMLNFESAYCVDIREIFSRQNPVDTQMLTEIVISAGKITFGNKESEKNLVPLVRGTSEDTLAYEESEANIKEADLSRNNAKVKTILKLRGKDIELPDMKIEKFKYTKRAEIDTAKLRNEFNSTGRKDFLGILGQNDDLLRKKGLLDIDIARTKKGLNPKGYDVHHKFPLDDSGTNNFDNLALIKNEPYHKALTNYQRSATKGMKAGDNKIIDWFTPNGNIYP